jgi:pimeloyl-[acyl-carrier protein] methyl ester esterase
LPDDALARKPTTLVLLPGLDGTDVFFRPLLAALPEWIVPMVVQFPTAGANDYPDLLRLVRSALANTSNCYVLGWSFAGPLALMLAAAEPNKVRGVILASTFVRPPRRIFARFRWAAVTPTVWMIRAGKRLPVWLFRGPADRLRQDKTETWKRVGTGMIAARIRTLLDVDARALLRDCPHRVLCVAGSHDRIVPHHNVEEIVRVQPSASVRLIAGHHFAIYTNPNAVADAIAEFMRSQEK